MEFDQRVVENQIKVHRRKVIEKKNMLSRKKKHKNLYLEIWLLYVHNGKKISFVELDENFSNDEDNH